MSDTFLDHLDKLKRQEHDEMLRRAAEVMMQELCGKRVECVISHDIVHDPCIVGMPRQRTSTVVFVIGEQKIAIEDTQRR